MKKKQLLKNKSWTGEAERKRKEQLGQETKLKPPLDMSSLPGDSGMKKSPLKSIVAIAAIVIIIILAIIVITSMGSDENATLLAQDSLQVENEPLKNNSNEEFSETIKEEPNPEVDYTSDYYEHDNGAFQREENQWIETSLESGIGPFTFKETGRDSDYIYLYDASRDMYLSLPTVEGYCYLQVKNELGDTEWQELYYLKIPK